MTVKSVASAHANFGAEIASWWRLNPEYSFVMLSDEDCHQFLRACCMSARREYLAYRLLRHGAQRADLFRAIFMREIGGVYVDQDSLLRAPLRSFIPPWASIVTSTAAPAGRGFRAAWNFNFLAFEPRCPILEVAVRNVVASVILQARFACLKDRMGCRGFKACVQNVTGSRTYQRAVEVVTRQHGCQSMVHCEGASHPMLRRLHVVADAELPMQHTPCHSKAPGKAGARHRASNCMRNESTPHYASIPQAAYTYFYTTRTGRQDHSSAPGYFNSFCRGAVRSPRNSSKLHHPGRLPSGTW